MAATASSIRVLDLGFAHTGMPALAFAVLFLGTNAMSHCTMGAYAMVYTA